MYMYYYSLNTGRQAGSLTIPFFSARFPPLTPSFTLEASAPRTAVPAVSGGRQALIDRLQLDFGSADPFAVQRTSSGSVTG